MLLDPEGAKQLISKLYTVDEQREFEMLVDESIEFLYKQYEELHNLARVFPRPNWFDGVQLTNICDELTEILEDRNQAKRQEQASNLAVGMACEVLGFYPEQIFPRVVRNGQCREAINDVDAAIDSYEAVIKDFSALSIAETLDEAEPLDKTERTILFAVRKALERLLDIQPKRKDENQNLLRRINNRLEMTFT